MKKFKLKLIIITLILASNINLISSTVNAETPPIPNSNSETSTDKWDLTWSDEFNDTEINLSNWTYDIDGHGWGNNELEYYTNRPENARIENGNLVIEARKEPYNGSAYTSARLKSEGLQNFLYGKIDARIKLTESQGLWPAFWMLGSNMASVQWPHCGEIDIMEHVNYSENIYGTLHWQNDNGIQSEGRQLKVTASDYHDYSIEWNPQSIQWFVDGTKYAEYDITNDNNGTTAFHKPFFLVLNLAVGGNLPKNPDNTTQFPAKMYVDYVRVYNQHSEDPSKINGRNSWYKDKTTNSWYYLDGNGNTYKGWLYIKDYWYYLGDDGQRKSGWVHTNGNWYYLDQNGIMQRNTVIDGCTLNEYGAWVY
jgi:beta-glucanase (GH16 family)